MAEQLRPERLAEALRHLITALPALSGRYDAKSQNIVRSPETLRLKIQSAGGHVNDHATIGEAPKDRDFFVTEPARRDVLKGKAPLASFTLTAFEDGGCILGLAVSHVLSDAAGVHKLAHYLADIYSSLGRDEIPLMRNFPTHLDVFTFGTEATKRDTLKTLKNVGFGKPIPLKGLLGTFVKFIIIKTMDKSRENMPVVIHFTADDLARLKAVILKESGEDWVSTNIALCAHFTRIMAKLSYGDDPRTDVQLGQLLDLRNRYFEAAPDAQRDFIGNAILIHIVKNHFPQGLQNSPRGELATFFKNWILNVDADDVKTRLDRLADCLRHGYSNPALDVKTPMIAMNNQSKIPAYDIGFDGQSPLRVIPQDVGDVVMFFPTPDGGVEIYLRDIVNPHNQDQLQSPEWQGQIFDF